MMRRAKWSAWSGIVLVIALCMNSSLAAGTKAGKPAGPTLEIANAKTLGIQDVSQAAKQFDQAFEDAFEVSTQANNREGGTAAPSTTRQATTVQNVTNCRALLELTSSITGTPSAADWPALLHQQAICQSLQALAHAQPARRSALPAQWTGLSATRDWPAAIWPNISEDSSKAAVHPGQTLAKWVKQNQWRMNPGSQGQGPTATLEDDSVTLQLRPLARGDFDADGLEDWLLLWQAHAKGGSWAATRALLVSRQPGQRALRLTWLPVTDHTDTKSPS